MGVAPLSVWSLVSAWPAVVVSAWPAVGSIAGGVGALALAWVIRAYRGRPGVNWFLGVFAAQALWCLSYGLGLLITDPTIRIAFEIAAWIGIIWTGIAFLGFALEYTGRGDVVRSRLFATVIGFGLLSTVVLATNELHGAFWTGFTLDPVFGVSTVSYAFGPWAYLVVAVETVLVASAVFLLVDTLLSYGPLYRRESAAVALSSLPPGFALVAWTLELGPVPQLQLAPLLFVPHVLLDAYAFNRAEMFERYPTTSRAAERTAIDDLADPIVALALDRRVVRMNPAAESLLGVASQTARDRPLNEFIDVPIPIGEGHGESGGSDTNSAESRSRKTVRIGAGGDRRTYSVSITSLTDPNETHVGHTVVFSDITEQERRRQQLEVLNRILRHNLRNDAGVVQGFGELLVDRLDDPELVRMADAVERRGNALATLGAKAKTVEQLADDQDLVTVSVDEIVESIVGDARRQHPDATVEVSIGTGNDAAEEWSSGGESSSAGEWITATRPDALRAILENTVENAISHHDGGGDEQNEGGDEQSDASPWVRVTLSRERGDTDADEADQQTNGNPGAASSATAASGWFVLTVEDDGPGIPPHEIATIDAGRETALEHGSGLGLWIVEWATGVIGAEVTYADRTPRGTRVQVRVPIVTE